MKDHTAPNSENVLINHFMLPHERKAQISV